MSLIVARAAAGRATRTAIMLMVNIALPSFLLKSSEYFFDDKIIITARPAKTGRAVTYPQVLFLRSAACG